MKRLELLAPGGDLDSAKAAIVAGADAIYCGLGRFSARSRAANLSLEELLGLVKLAHKHECKVFLTLNIVILEHEIPALLGLLNKLVNSRIDAIIVQDMGLFYLLSKYFETLEVHASTQVTTHNEGQISFLSRLGASRVILSRELSIDEIKSLTAFAHLNDVLSEVFVHGSYCIGFSGLCYFNSAYGGNSGNRGRCSQPCRDQYQTTATGNDYPLNLKDNSAFSDLQLLADAGVDSLKIEGRIKGPSYVFTVVNSWRKQLQRHEQDAPLPSDDADLYKVFNRGFSDAYLHGDINKAMFIDNPRDNTIRLVEKENAGASSTQIEQAQQALHNERLSMQDRVLEKIRGLCIARTPLTIDVSGAEGSPMKVSVRTPEDEFVVFSESSLRKAEQPTSALNALKQRFRRLNNAEYVVEKLILSKLQRDLCIPFNELTRIKDRIAFLLNDSVELRAPVAVPALQGQHASLDEARLAVLIASKKDLDLCRSSATDVYYKLPEGFKGQCAGLLELFSSSERLLPWFPAVLIGADYLAAITFLKQVRPKLIVTNNSGIAFHASENGIDWIAGPHLNITNSFSLLAMSEKFNCHGSFISNELNRAQIAKIRRPDDFKLYYSMYHPLLLMSSRQCLFQQTIGCKKTVIDERCIQDCSKSTSITNSRGKTFLIDKQKNGYPSIYGDQPFLNADIVNDLPGFFDGLFIDLCDIGPADKIVQDKARVIGLFEDLLRGKADAEGQLEELIVESTNSQYVKGL